jgi:hypothetical protein
MKLKLVTSKLSLKLTKVKVWSAWLSLRRCMTPMIKWKVARTSSLTRLSMKTALKPKFLNNYKFQAWFQKWLRAITRQFLLTARQVAVRHTRWRATDMRSRRVKTDAELTQKSTRKMLDLQLGLYARYSGRPRSARPKQCRFTRLSSKSTTKKYLICWTHRPSKGMLPKKYRRLGWKSGGVRTNSSSLKTCSSSGATTQITQSNFTIKE